jgi:hypothetical protein
MIISNLGIYFESKSGTFCPTFSDVAEGVVNIGFA